MWTPVSNVMIYYYSVPCQVVVGRRGQTPWLQKQLCSGLHHRVQAPWQANCKHRIQVVIVVASVWLGSIGLRTEHEGCKYMVECRFHYLKSCDVYYNPVMFIWVTHNIAVVNELNVVLAVELLEFEVRTDMQSSSYARDVNTNPTFSWRVSLLCCQCQDSNQHT